MLNAEVPYVRYLIGWIAKKFDYINRVTKRFHFRSMWVHRHTLPSRCYASPRKILRDRRIFLKYYVPQQFPRGESMPRLPPVNLPLIPHGRRSAATRRLPPRVHTFLRKYALEAIIKLLFISLYHDKCLLFMLELYLPET